MSDTFATVIETQFFRAASMYRLFMFGCEVCSD